MEYFVFCYRNLACCKNMQQMYTIQTNLINSMSVIWKQCQRSNLDKLLASYIAWLCDLLNNLNQAVMLNIGQIIIPLSKM